MAVDQLADGVLRHRAEHIDAGRDHAQQRRAGGQIPNRSANSFGSATVTALKVVEMRDTTISSATTTRHMSSFATRACAAACLRPERSS